CPKLQQRYPWFRTAARSDTTAGWAGPGPGWPSISLTKASNDESSLAIKGRPNSARPLYLASAMQIIEPQTDLGGGSGRRVGLSSISGRGETRRSFSEMPVYQPELASSHQRRQSAKLDYFRIANRKLSSKPLKARMFS